MHRLPPLQDMIGQLIATPSVSAVSPVHDQPNLAVIELLADWCETLGFRTEIQPIADGKANLIATLGSGPGGLILAGHTDTVPYDDKGWHSDPFRLHEADNRLYGLGTADMKAFLAIVLDSLRELDPEKLTEPLILIATADEESTMAGAKALAHAAQPKARRAIIGEPTGLKPVRMHKGILMEAIRLKGCSGHSSNPALGNSALEGMHRVMQALLDWRSELQKKHVNEAFAVPVPTLNLGHIHGGDNPNRICADCELYIDLRPLPGMGLNELRQELHQRIQQGIADTGLILETEALFDGVPAMQTPADAELVQLAEKLTGSPAEAVAYGTEAPYLQQLVSEVIVLGPGSIDQAHQPNEYLELEQIGPMQEILQNIITQTTTKP